MRSQPRASLLRPADVAEELHVSTREVQRLLRQGTLPGIKVGRRWRVAPAALDRYIEEGGNRGPGQ